MAKHNKIELLSPVGDREALRAAVCAGADAVYLGFRSFGARAAAANFDGEELAQGISYAHLHHVRVYVTVNTLIKEQELEDVQHALQTIAQARADAVIVQDMGVASLVREHFPTLALHASTQMALHNATGIRFAKAEGFERVVLARECGLEEIKAAAKAGLETEVFVHGALCAGVSGQCLLSSMSGGRSGNRGRCAQPCRQDLTLGEHNGALISMKDLCLRDHLPKLCAAGVSALKIEGRLKRPEYVAIVTESYRRALDELVEGRFQPGGEQEAESLRQIFHRGGFTVGHAMGAQDADLCEMAHPGHGGVLIGSISKVKNGLATVSLCRDIHDGDSLQLRGAEEADMRYSGKPQNAGEEAVVRLRPGLSPAAGDEVFRLTDAAQMERAAALMQERPIPVTMAVFAAVGEPVRLTISDEISDITVTGDTVQQAKTRAITEDDVARQLSKLGDTPFVLDKNIEVNMAEDAFLPMGALNALRRDGLEALAQERRAAFFGQDKEALLFAEKWNDVQKTNRGMAEKPPKEDEGKANEKNGDEARNTPMEKVFPKPWTDTLAVQFRDASLALPLLDAGADLLLFEPPVWIENALTEHIKALPEGAWLVLPAQMTDLALKMAERITAQADAKKLGGVVLGSIGQLGAHFGLPIALGSGIPLTNTQAMKAIAKYQPVFYRLWPELSKTELIEMNERSEADNATILPLLGVYGREPVMLLNHCPERAARGLHQNRAGCALCKGDRMACGREDVALIDRKGFRFPLQRIRTEEGCVVQVLNALPTDLRKQGEARKALGAGMLLHFTVESPDEQIELTREFMLSGQGDIPSATQEGIATNGHFFRGVQ